MERPKQPSVGTWGFTASTRKVGPVSASGGSVLLDLLLLGRGGGRVVVRTVFEGFVVLPSVLIV